MSPFMRQDMDTFSQSDKENRLIAERRAKLEGLREEGHAFPNDFRRTAEAGFLETTFENEDKQTLESASRHFSVAGRLIRNRSAFLLIQDSSGTIQLYINRKKLSDGVIASIKNWDLGDIVGASGPLHSCLLYTSPSPRD